MQKHHLKLEEKDRQELGALLTKKSLTVKLHRRVSVLLLLDQGKSFAQVGRELGITYPSMQGICDKYRDRPAGAGALEYLSDRPRTGRPAVVSGGERAGITALACSRAPRGHAAWTLRLLADKAVELGICGEISHTHVGNILKKTPCGPTSGAPGASA